MKIALFVEDAGHLGFIRELVERVLEEEGIDAEVLERNATGGRGATISSLRKYLRDIGRSEVFAEIVITAVDGNCTGWQERVRELRELAVRAQYAGQLVAAVPDPHVEVWYLADGHAVRVVAGSGRQEQLPAYKCEPDIYKALLRDSFRSAEIDPPAGGTEYGEEIARELDLNAASRGQPSLDAFLDDLRGAIRVASAAAEA